MDNITFSQIEEEIRTAVKNYIPNLDIQSIDIQDAQNDPTLLSELTEERGKLDKFFELLLAKGHKPILHFYGHFHSSHSELINGTDHRLLGVGELFYCR